MQCNFSIKFYMKSYKNGLIKESNRELNFIYFKLWGESCTYNWFKWKSVFFHLCKGAIHEINTSVSHLCLQYFIFLLPLFNSLLAYTPVSICMKTLGLFLSTLFNQPLFVLELGVVELGQRSRDVQRV